MGLCPQTYSRGFPRLWLDCRSPHPLWIAGYPQGYRAGECRPRLTRYESQQYYGECNDWKNPV